MNSIAAGVFRMRLLDFIGSIFRNGKKGKRILAEEESSFCVLGFVLSLPSCLLILNASNTCEDSC